MDFLPTWEQTELIRALNCVAEQSVIRNGEMIDVLNESEPENNFEPSGITPPVINKWTETAETVVYGSGDEQNEYGGAASGKLSDGCHGKGNW